MQESVDYTFVHPYNALITSFTFREELFFYLLNCCVIKSTLHFSDMAKYVCISLVGGLRLEVNLSRHNASNKSGCGIGE